MSDIEFLDTLGGILALIYLVSILLWFRDRYNL